MISLHKISVSSIFPSFSEFSSAFQKQPDRLHIETLLQNSFPVKPIATASVAFPMVSSHYQLSSIDPHGDRGSRHAFIV